jgi:hypothetical protein
MTWNDFLYQVVFTYTMLQQNFAACPYSFAVTICLFILLLIFMILWASKPHTYTTIEYVPERDQTEKLTLAYGALLTELATMHRTYSSDMKTLVTDTLHAQNKFSDTVSSMHNGLLDAFVEMQSNQTSSE